MGQTHRPDPNQTLAEQVTAACKTVVGFITCPLFIKSNAAKALAAEDWIETQIPETFRVIARRYIDNEVNRHNTPIGDTGLTPFDMGQMMLNN